MNDASAHGPARPAEPQSEASAKRFYSPHLPWRPKVSPPSVEDKDACAIYASVRKDGTASREPVTLALANLQKMLHRAGNVDGEGDGCGLLIDIPRKIWGEEIRQGGHASKRSSGSVPTGTWMSGGIVSDPHRAARSQRKPSRR